MAKKKVKKAAGKKAKKQTRQPVKRGPVKTQRAQRARATKPKAKAKLSKPTKKKTGPPLKARKSAPSAKPIRKVMARKAPARSSAPKTSVKQLSARPMPKALPAAAKPKALAPPKRAAKRAEVAPPPTLQRERRRLPEAEAEAFNDVSEDSRLMSSARAGHDELRSEMKRHTEASPAMTAGDVDAKWQDAYALGDEAPGGDNMTPDQDRVDDIGKALGIEYADDEELLGGDEILERDEHRWELDPASKDEDEDL